jgi:adenine-specific DNA methylase
MRLIKNTSKEKLRGGFYTPPSIANFILRWGINGAKEYDILEPSCGDGVFLEQLKSNSYQFNSITGIEYDEIEAKKSEAINLNKSKIFISDFHKFCNSTQERYDLIIGNPPYIRYQFFEEQQKIEANKIFNRAFLKYSKLTNAWVSFVVGSSLLLKEKGKIGFVIPAELLQVSYAKQLRQFLSNFYSKINIISFKKLVFPDIQQEVVLLLCEKNSSHTNTIEHLELNDASELIFLDINLLKSPSKKIDTNTNKWTFYFLEQQEIDFIEELSNNLSLPRFGEFANIEVGITTGANNFFSVPLSTVLEYHLEDFAHPLVGRSVQVEGAIFSKDDWLKNKDAQARSYLLVFPPKDKLDKNSGALSYLQYGESLEIHKGYKTGIRDEWHIVPSLWKPDCFFIRRNNLFPKLIINKADAYSTDTMHRVRVNPDTNIENLSASFYNSLSFAFTEILGRSYGGGVLELMPSEATKIVLPYLKDNKGLINEIDIMLRKKIDIRNILEYTDNIILKNSLGFSSLEIKLSNNIWSKLSQRRLNRAKKLFVK